MRFYVWCIWFCLRFPFHLVYFFFIFCWLLFFCLLFAFSFYIFFVFVIVFFCFFLENRDLLSCRDSRFGWYLLIVCRLLCVSHFGFIAFCCSVFFFKTRQNKNQIKWQNISITTKKKMAKIELASALFRLPFLVDMAHAPAMPNQNQGNWNVFFAKTAKDIYYNCENSRKKLSDQATLKSHFSINCCGFFLNFRAQRWRMFAYCTHKHTHALHCSVQCNFASHLICRLVGISLNLLNWLLFRLSGCVFQQPYTIHFCVLMVVVVVVAFLFYSRVDSKWWSYAIILFCVCALFFVVVDVVFHFPNFYRPNHVF